jgi:DNA-binding protein HU-beta
MDTGFPRDCAVKSTTTGTEEEIRKQRDTSTRIWDSEKGTRRIYMATSLTKTALVRQLAEKLELTNKQSAAFLDLLAETAIKETKKNGVFVIPGLGRLVKAERKARIGRNPQTGEQIKIKAKTVVKFRVAKAAKDVIAPPKK